MGAYIGSMLGKLGNSYLDERENQANRKRREQMDAEAAQDRQAAIQDRRTTLQRLQEQMEFQQTESTRKTQLAEQEREALRRALLSKGLPAEQVEGMLGDPVASRSYLTQPKPTKNRASSTFTLDGKSPQLGSFDAEEGAYYDGQGNRVENAQPYQKPMSEYERQSLDIRRQAANRVGAPPRGRPPTDAQRKNNALLMIAEQANTNLRSMGQKFAPSFKEKMKSRVGMDVGNLMTDEEFQRFNQAALQLSDAWLRYTSGAAVPETEVARFAATFTPRPGDAAGTLVQKARAREMIIRAMKTGSGAAITEAQGNVESTLDDIFTEMP